MFHDQLFLLGDLQRRFRLSPVGFQRDQMLLELGAIERYQHVSRTHVLAFFHDFCDRQGSAVNLVKDPFSLFRLNTARRDHGDAQRPAAADHRERAVPIAALPCPQAVLAAAPHARGQHDPTDKA